MSASSEALARETFVRPRSGLRLRVREWGEPDGQPVLILHGGGQDGRTWSGVCSRLPPELRAIVPDQRGHGESEWSPDGDYSCSSQVADLLSLLDDLAIERCGLAGHSMGGLNALQLAGTHPDRVRGLVLADVGTETRDSGLQRVRSRPRPQSPPPETFDIRLLDHVPTYCGDTHARRALLLDARTPLLVLRGEHSRILTRESAEQTARLAGGRLLEIPDSGHNLPLANPAAVAEALGTFFVALRTS